MFYQHLNRLLWVVVAIALALIGTAHATIHILDNTANSIASFRTLQGANDSAATGDTIFLVGSITNYGGVTINHTLHLIGTGYLMSNITPAPYNTNDPRTGDITITAAAPNTSLEGLNTYNITIGAYGCRLARCYTSAITVNANNDTVQQCYGGGLLINGTANNPLIRNNILYNISVQNGAGMMEVYNNIFTTNANLYRTAFFNNIVGGNVTLNANASAYNCISSSNIGNLFGNQSNIAWASLFYTSYPSDRSYTLRETAPVFGTGFNGSDVGPYFGPTPYIFSGLSKYPNIIAVASTGHGTTAIGLQVSVTAKARN